MNISLEFERQPIRLVVIGHEIWCVLADLASVLQEPVSSLLGQLEADEQMSMPTEDGERDVLWIGESGIYSLIRTWQHPISQRLKKWWREDVLAWARQCGTDSPTTIAAREALDLAVPIFRELGVESERLGVWLLEQYRRIYPTYADIFVDIRTLEAPPPSTATAKTGAKKEEKVSSSTIRLSPTEIGEIIAQKYELGYIPSPQKVNRALAALNFQILVPRVKGKEWKLTKIGQQYGRVENCVDRQSKNRLQIRWVSDVAPLVAQQLGII